MKECSKQPKPDDLVLGGQASTPAQGVVLGGLEGVRWHLKSPVASQRVAALYEALKYGEAGLDVVIQALSLRSWQVQKAALSILQGRTGHKGWVNTLALSRDGEILVSGSNDGTIKLWGLE